MDSRDACLNLNYFKTLTEVGEGHLKGGGMRSSCGGGGGGRGGGGGGGGGGGRGTLKGKIKAPSTRIRIFLKTELSFSLAFSPPSTRCRLILSMSTDKKSGFRVQ